MMRRSLGAMVGLLALSWAFAALPSCETSAGCGVGTEGCSCTSGGICDPGLMCLSKKCVRLGGSGGGAPAGTGGAPPASPGTGPAPTPNMGGMMMPPPMAAPPADAGAGCPVSSNASACERCLSETCCSQSRACAGTPACVQLTECAARCPSGDGMCISTCVSAHPAGAAQFNAYIGCATERCGMACSGGRGGAGGTGGAGGAGGARADAGPRDAPAPAASCLDPAAPRGAPVLAEAARGAEPERLAFDPEPAAAAPCADTVPKEP
jgi:hypothetical protein